MRPITVTLTLGVFKILAPVWIVTSPRGVEVCRMSDRVAALNTARQMAALDQLLARVNRIERAAGWHPSHGTPPPDSPPTFIVKGRPGPGHPYAPGPLVLLDGGQ